MVFLGVSMKREQFMQLLDNLEGIYIKAQYDPSATEAR